MRAATIFIVEDEPIVAKDIASFIKAEGYLLAGIAHDSETALDKIHSLQPDLILLDVNIDGTKNGIEVGEIIKTNYGLPFIYLTSFSDDDTLAAAIDTNPYGYIVKPFEEKSLKTTIAVALSNFQLQSNKIGKSLKEINKNLLSPLSEKEFQILIDIGQGLTNEEIANEHFITLNTVKFHLKKIFSKLGVNNRGSAVKILHQL